MKKGRQIVTKHVFGFIQRLIVHIPDKYSREVRYYGFYANNSRLIINTSLFTPKQMKAMEIKTKWKHGLLDSFGYTPLMCNICGGRLQLSYEDSYYPIKEVIFISKYEFNTIKKLVSDKEKLSRIKMYESDTGLLVDVNKFMSREIYDEYIDMKCLKCNHEMTFEFDILEEIMHMNNMDYPDDICHSCHKVTMVPKDIYNIKKKMS